MLIPIAELIAQITPQLRTLTAEQARAEITQYPDSLVLDVREPGEVAEHPIDGSVNIPRGVLEMKLSAEYADPDLRIYIHCASGARATLAAEQLQRIGYRRVTAIRCPLQTIATHFNRKPK